MRPYQSRRTSDVGSRFESYEVLPNRSIILARFRVKKKMKTVNLERTVADLTGRTEELEREAADLRRENGWLKEIILLKSRSIGGLGPSESQPLGSASFRESREGNDNGSPSMERSNQKGKGKDS
ncbi:hypothetical protein EDC04DRAFT_2638132 [Pisolithus marmoratus]|nr:hypothetical protein EDC04DRAFT_2638132 [Pisolithus marmoratus]